MLFSRQMEDEDIEASELSMMLAVPPYILSGVPLREVCAVLERCDLFVGNDSGTAHLAAAMDCPTVVVSRHPANGDAHHANSPARFAPRCSHYRVVQPSSGEGHCTTSCLRKAPHCIRRVTVDQVIAAMRELLPRVTVPESGRPTVSCVGPLHVEDGVLALAALGPS